eukprot:5063739-Alexandrium_andersonii.AAC.1
MYPIGAGGGPGAARHADAVRHWLDQAALLGARALSRNPPASQNGCAARRVACTPWAGTP